MKSLCFQKSKNSPFQSFSLEKNTQNWSFLVPKNYQKFEENLKTLKICDVSSGPSFKPAEILNARLQCSLEYSFFSAANWPPCSTVQCEKLRE